MLGSKGPPHNELPHLRLASNATTQANNSHNHHHQPHLKLANPDDSTTKSTAVTRAAVSEESMISNDNNLMPSMVVKQQRDYLTKAPAHHDQTTSKRSSPDGDAVGQQQSEPAPLNDILLRTRMVTDSDCGRAGGHMFDQDGLVLPRRVPHHHQQGVDGQQPTMIRDLNRELKFNQVRGLRLLDQKSELKRAMEKLESTRRRKEAEQERLTRRSSLELRLEERAQRLAARENGAAGGQSSESQKNSSILS